MTDQTVPAPRHGKHGAKRHTTPDPRVAALIPPADPSLTPTGDITKGRDAFPLLGNGPPQDLGDCGLVFAAVALMFQNALGLNDRQQPVYVDGFVEPSLDWVVNGYHAVAALEGEPFTTGEGPGVGPYALAKWLLTQTDYPIAAVGVWGPVSGATLAQAIRDFQGGVGVMWALDPDFDQEFDEGACWGSLSATPDDQDGHFTCGAGWSQDGAVLEVETWTRIQCTTASFVAACNEGAVIVLSQGYASQIGPERTQELIATYGLTTDASQFQGDGWAVPGKGVVADVEHALYDLFHAAEDEATKTETAIRKVVERGVELAGTSEVARILEELLKGVRP